MKRIRYMVIDTVTDKIVDECPSKNDAIDRSGDLNRSESSLEEVEDGVYQYSDPEPRYKPVKAKIIDID